MVVFDIQLVLTMYGFSQTGIAQTSLDKRLRSGDHHH